MAEILSNQFTTIISKETQTITKEILSNQFTTTISKATQTTTKQILSNQFTTTISRVSEVPATGDELSTVVNIYKKGILLTPVSGIPTADQYAVTITGTTRCTATLEDDNKTIKLLTLISYHNSLFLNII